MGAGGHRTELVGAVASLIDKENLHQLFREREPTKVQYLNYRELRRAAYEFANAILELAPVCEQQQRALRHVRDAVFAAREAIEEREIL